jgi:phage-related baseplate assembly protein
MTAQQFDALVTWMDDYEIWRCDFQHIPPTSINMDVNANVYCAAGSDLPKIATYIQYILKNNFGVRQGSLGYSVYRNDLYAALNVKHFSLQVDYATLTSPTTDLIIGKTDFISIGQMNINTAFSSRNYNSFVPNGPNS